MAEGIVDNTCIPLSSLKRGVAESTYRVSCEQPWLDLARIDG